MKYQQLTNSFIGKHSNNSESVMKLIPLIIGVILSGEFYSCFYFPQSYNVKMHHHQHLLMFGKNIIQEKSVFKLKAPDEHENIINEHR